MHASDDTPTRIGEAMRLDTAGELEFMRTLVDSTVDAIIVHEPTGRLVFFNQGACELLGVDAGRFGSLPPFGWIGPGAEKGAADRLESILHEGRLTFDSTVQRADGTIIPTEVVASRIETTQGPLVVAVIRNSCARREAQERLEHLAYHDGLTGLSNRVAFEEQLARAIAGVRRHGDLLILAYIDLDRFKPINDEFGHEAGDRVLIEVARRLEGCIREQDMVARLGGDEFVVLLQRAQTVGEIAVIGSRLHSAICQPIQIGTATVEIGAAIGFAIFDASVDDARSIVVKADAAMYESKRGGGEPWRVHDSTAAAG